MTSTVAHCLWRRRDAPGHDACRLIETASGWKLEGCAVFRHKEGPAALAYSVACDAQWRTRSARVSGFLGARSTEITIERTEGGDWLLSGTKQPAAAEQIDLDLNFTPATNLIALRRLKLAVGERAGAPAAYLAFPEERLVVLEQFYRRLDADRYDYEAPAFGYHEVLEFGDNGFVVNYPPLWERVTD
jgi:hypothetical protein